MNEFEFQPDRTTDYGVSCPWASKKYPYRPYNGENGVSTFSLLFLIGSFWYFHITRTSIKAWMSLNFLKWDLTLAHWTQVSDRCLLGYLFSGTVRPRRLKLVTHVNNGWMYHVYQNQSTAAYLFFISPFFFLSNCQTLKLLSHFSQKFWVIESWNLVYTWTMGWMYRVYRNQLLLLIHPFFHFSFSPIFKD